MSLLEIKNLSFTYPNRTVCALNQINFSLNEGEFIVLCGKSGCGKSTLLKQMKTALTPHGTSSGEVLYQGKSLVSIDIKEQAVKIGYVLQNPENQIVTDKVWHELAFGLENIGTSTETIRLRVAEMASFFGIEAWFHKNTNELSGGQKQLLNLASVMAMQPGVLILDEPTSQLDPIAASEFLQTLKKINTELGTAVILSEQRLENVFPIADRIAVMEKGRIIFDGCPQEVGKLIAEKHSDLFEALPAPIQIHTAVPNTLPCPLTVKDGRQWLNSFLSDKKITKRLVEEQKEIVQSEPTIQVKDVWFRYEKEAPDVIRNLSFEVSKGELFCILGGNGSGKSTTLSLLGGINRPQHGKIEIFGKNINHYSSDELYKNLALLPQDPQSLFVMNTVRLDLQEVLSSDNNTNNSKKEANQRNCDDLLHEISKLAQITSLLDCHPYDLSGGEQQRAALAKVLLKKPKILLLDEPTKGIDSSFKLILSKILKDLTQNDVTIIMVSHDIEFCAKYADRCALFFDGSIVTSNRTNPFFSGNSFYTTAANRMSRHIFPNAVTNEDVISLCKQNQIN